MKISFRFVRKLRRDPLKNLNFATNLSKSLFSRLFNWLLFIILSIIWGSSFILMKGGLIALSPYQVASFRIITAGLLLLPYGIRAFKVIPPSRILLVFLSGTFGSLLPAYLFCLAEENMDSGLAGVLNSLTPVFTLVIAFFVFAKKTALVKIAGIVIAFSGVVFLYFSQPVSVQSSNTIPVLFIIMATILYGTNVNLVSRYLADFPSLYVAGMALMLNAIPALMVLNFTNIRGMEWKHELLISTGCTLMLGIVGTALATVLFYRLIQRAGIVFSSMVTYAIPLVAILWGVYFGEKIGVGEVLSMGVILLGVFLANGKIPEKFRKSVIYKK